MKNMLSLGGGEGRNKFNAFMTRLRGAIFSIKIFRLIIRLIIIFAVLSIPYWGFFASDRYVSTAIVLIQNTDQADGPPAGLPAGLAGMGATGVSDQLLLREYLLSVDMLQKLDAAFDLRSHYSNSRWDVFSRMLFKNEPIERFYQYWLSRVEIDYDDYGGVLDISVQAYDPKLAQAIVQFMVKEGQAHMNEIGHQLAESQVAYLTKQVSFAHDRMMDTSQDLLEFQNKQGLAAPQVTADSINSLIDTLNVQKTQIQTQLAALPKNVDPNQPTVVMLKRNLQALDQQIAQKQAELTSPSRRTLNYSVEEFQRLQMQLSFEQDLYKTAISALEQGRLTAARTLKIVSILQAPTMPVYPLEPERIYNIIMTLIVAAAVIGVLKLLESIVLDHMD